MRRSLRVSLITLVALIAIEGLAQVAFLATHGRLWAPEELATPYRKALEQPLQRRGNPTGTTTRSLIPHPYLGYVRAGESGKREASGGYEDRNLNVFGKKSATDPNEVRLVVTGGAIAYSLVKRGALQKLVQEKLDTAGVKKSIRIVDVTQPGYKQPQQLYGLYYLVAQGLKVDLILDVGSPRETLMPALANWLHATHPLYPANWRAFVTDRRGIASPYQIAAIAEAQRALKDAVIRKHWPLYYRSAVTGFFATWRGSERHRKVSAARRAAVGLTGAFRIESHGPPFRGSAQAAALYAVQVWRRGTLLMAGLAKEHQAEYLQIILPDVTPPPANLSDKTSTAYQAGLSSYVRTEKTLLGQGINLRALRLSEIGWTGAPGACCGTGEGIADKVRETIADMAAALILKADAKKK